MTLLRLNCFDYFPSENVFHLVSLLSWSLLLLLLLLLQISKRSCIVSCLVYFPSEIVLYYAFSLVSANKL